MTERNIPAHVAAELERLGISDEGIEMEAFVNAGWVTTHDAGIKRLCVLICALQQEIAASHRREKRYREAATLIAEALVNGELEGARELAETFVEAQDALHPQEGDPDGR